MKLDEANPNVSYFLTSMIAFTLIHNAYQESDNEPDQNDISSGNHLSQNDLPHSNDR